MSQELESYLVKLGFQVDTTSLAKFNNAISDVTKAMSKTVLDLGGDFAKLSFGITGALLTVGAASAKVASDFADFDQQMRLGALGAFMTKDAFTAMNESLKLAGVTLAQATWDAESHQRFLDGVQLIERLNKALGPDAEANARGIRDLKWQFSALGEELKYLSFAVGSDLFAKLFGNGDAQKALQRINEWLINNIPKLADEISTDLVPILKDAWEITKDLGEVFKDAFAIFQNIVGVLSDDDTLTGTAVTFESVATSVKHTVEWVDSLLKSIIHLEDALLHLDFSQLTGGDLAHLAELGLLTGSGRSLAWNLGKGLLTGGAGAEAGAAAGGVALAPLAVAGAGVAGIYELHAHKDAVEAFNTRFLQSIGRIPLTDASLPGIPTNTHDRLRANADAIAAKTGADPSLVYAQLAHETGNGTNRGYRDLHNLAGIEDGHGHYRAFSSDEDFQQVMSRVLIRDGVAAAKNANDYAAILKKSGYFEDALPTYQRGMAQFQGQYGAPGKGGNGSVTVNVQVKTDANPTQIASAVKEVLNDHNAKQSRYSDAANVGYGQ